MNQDDGFATEYHRPVMVDEVVALLRPVEGIVVDATFGGGGHSKAICEEIGNQVELIGIDRDAQAAKNAADLGVRFLSGDFRDLDSILDGAGIGDVGAVLFDFGVSSRQLDDPQRGFSYRFDGPLDMRMDSTLPKTAADLVNEMELEELRGVIARFGEEPMARRIAEAIIRNRPFSRTLELAEVVADATPAALRRRGHPARKTFQALRIAVNHELEAVEAGLDQALARLEVGGRCVAISYHSLEDRIVKGRFAPKRCVCPPGLPVCVCGGNETLNRLTPRAVKPSLQEIQGNPRARSARLRAVERRAA